MAKRDITGAVDFVYLEGFTRGDEVVIGEILSLFREQAEMWGQMLEADNVGWRDAVHTVKGAGRGIGAFRLGDACELAEMIGAAGLTAVRDQLDAALMDIAAYEHELALRSLRTTR